MQNHMPESCKEEQELVPGGDLRLGGNTWLRNAFVESKALRVPRENEVRKVIHQLANIMDICSLNSISW